MTTGSGQTGPWGAEPEDGLSHWEGEPLAVWESLWAVPRFEAYAMVRSTNDRIRELASEGAPSFTVVVAEEQTAGRGRNGRPWASAASLGLWISTLLRIPKPELRTAVPIFTGLAVCRAVEHVAPELDPRIKWPNDVLLGERKLCGVLCESGPADGLIVGVGLNVLHRPMDFPEHLRGSAVSLAMATGRRVSRATLAGALLGSLRALLSAGAMPDAGVGSEIDGRDALRGRRVRVSEGPVGEAVGIDAHGRLQLRVATGELVRVVGGSVSIVDG